MIDLLGLVLYVKVPTSIMNGLIAMKYKGSTVAGLIVTERSGFESHHLQREVIFADGWYHSSNGEANDS